MSVWPRTACTRRFGGEGPARLREAWSVPVLPDYATVWRAQLVYDRALPVSACYLLRDPDFRPV